MKYIAHRGLSSHYPENTLLAFEKAIHAGAEALELDVHQCKSGELVVIHDADVSRTTTGRGGLSDMSVEDVRRLRVKDATGNLTTLVVPLLTEVLTFCEGIQVNIEVKTENTVQALGAVLTDYIAAGRSPRDFLVSSFKKPEIIRFRRLMPEVPAAVILWGTPSADEIDLYASWGIQAIHLDYNDGDITEAVVRQVHDRGLLLGAYTINTVADAEAADLLGVDYLFTDDITLFL